MEFSFQYFPEFNLGPDVTASSSLMDFCPLPSCEVQDGGSRKTIFDFEGNQNVTLTLSVWLRAEFQIDSEPEKHQSRSSAGPN